MSSCFSNRTTMDIGQRVQMPSNTILGHDSDFPQLKSISLPLHAQQGANVKTRTPSTNHNSAKISP